MSAPSSQTRNGNSNTLSPTYQESPGCDEDDEFISSNKSSFSRLKEQLKELDRRSWRQSSIPDEDVDIPSSKYTPRLLAEDTSYKPRTNRNETQEKDLAFGTEENDKELEDLHRRVAAVRARYLEPKEEQKPKNNWITSRSSRKEKDKIDQEKSPFPLKAPEVTISDHDADDTSASVRQSHRNDRRRSNDMHTGASDLNTPSSETFLEYLKPRSPLQAQKNVDHHYKAKYLTPILYDFHNPPRSLSNSPASPLFSKKLDDDDYEDDSPRRGAVANGHTSNDFQDADSYLYPSSRRISFSATDYKYSTPEYTSRYLRKEGSQPRSVYTPRETPLKANNPYISPMKSRYSLDSYTTPASTSISSRKTYTSDPDSYTKTPGRRGSFEKSRQNSHLYNGSPYDSLTPSGTRRRGSLTLDTDTRDSSYHRKSVGEADDTERDDSVKTRLSFSRQKHSRRSNESAGKSSPGEETGEDQESNISVQEPGRWVGNGYMVETALLTADRGYLLWTSPKGKMDVVIRYEDTNEDFSCFIDPQYLGVAVYQIKSQTNKRQIVDGIENPLYSSNPCHKTSPSRTRPENNFELKSIGGEVKLHLEVLKGKHAPNPQLPFKINYTLAL